MIKKQIMSILRVEEKKHLHSQKIQNTSKGIRLGVAELLRRKVALFWVK